MRSRGAFDAISASGQSPNNGELEMTTPKSTRDFAIEAFDAALGLIVIMSPKTEADLMKMRNLYAAMFELQIATRDEELRKAFAQAAAMTEGGR